MATARQSAAATHAGTGSGWFTVEDWFTADGVEHQVQERFSGSKKTRHASFRTVLFWPEKYHQTYHVPSGIEAQPF